MFAAVKPRNQTESTKPSHQVRETPAIFLEHCRKFQSQSETGLYMAHNRFGPDLSLFDEKIEVCFCAYRLWLPCLDKQAARA